MAIMRNSTIREVLKDEECFEIIRKKLRQDSMDDFSLVTYEVVPINQVHGYMGRYFTLKATVACSKSPLETKNIHFFTKIPPPTSSPQYDFIQEYGTFKKEVALYTTVFPEVLDGSIKRCIPECFLGLENDVIVLEDMVHNGYRMTDKLKPFDFEHCAVLMRMLAKFHAMSFIFEEQYKRSLPDEFSHCMQETLWPLKDGRAKAMFNAAVKGIISMVDLMPNLDEMQRNLFKEEITNLTTDHAIKLLPSVKHKNVLCHGDLWANNILYKYDAEDKPSECCLIDFQLARYNPPAHDILSFLQFTTTRKLREQHSDELFKIYYESMTEALSEADLNISTVLPWCAFMESIEDLKIMCMIHGVLNIPIMLLEPSAASKYFSEETGLLETILYDDRTPLVCGQMTESLQYRTRMLDALLELYDNVVLKK